MGASPTPASFVLKNPQNSIVMRLKKGAETMSVDYTGRAVGKRFVLKNLQNSIVMRLKKGAETMCPSIIQGAPSASARRAPG